jgi:hypothetical protein
MVVVPAAEIALRLRFESPAEITGAAVWEAAEFGDLTYHWDRYHPVLGWTNEPGYVSDRAVPFQITINSIGLRGAREYSRDASPGVTRIALFGDSLAFGEEVDDDETIGAHLERQRDGLEVLNYGVHGYGLGQSVLRLELEGGELDPDHYLLTVLFPENLVRDRVRHFLHPKPAFRLQDGTVVVDNTPVPEASRMPLLMRHSFAAAWLLGRSGAWHRGLEGRGPDLELGRKMVERAAASCRARRRPLTVVVMLAPAGVVRYLAEPSWRRRFEAQQREFMAVEASVVDLVPTQVGAYAAEGEALLAPRAHWSARGNQLWAAAILEHLDLE